MYRNDLDDPYKVDLVLSLQLFFCLIFWSEIRMYTLLLRDFLRRIDIKVFVSSEICTFDLLVLDVLCCARVLNFGNFLKFDEK